MNLEVTNMSGGKPSGQTKNVPSGQQMHVPSGQTKGPSPRFIKLYVLVFSTSALIDVKNDDT